MTGFVVQGHILKFCKIEFIPVMQSWMQSLQSVSHDPSEIIIICWFAAQEKKSFFLSMLKTVVLLNIFVETDTLKKNSIYRLHIHTTVRQIGVSRSPQKY